MIISANLPPHTIHAMVANHRLVKNKLVALALLRQVTIASEINRRKQFIIEQKHNRFTYSELSSCQIVPE